MNTATYFDASNPDTPAGMTPVLALEAIDGIPGRGTGLVGAAFAPGTRISNLDAAAQAANGTADASFIASELAYAAAKSDTDVATFLGADAASLTGDGSVEMGPSALAFTGYIYIPAGAHEIKVVSDDGFGLEIGGVDFTEFTGSRASAATARVAEFDGGLYEIDLLYFDQGGSMSLALEIDGLPVDQSAFYQSVEDFQTPPADVPLVPVEDYHPSFFVGEQTLDVAIDTTTSDARDVINGLGADDVINGQGGDDELMGGFGDDILRGGAGDDVLDGGYGSDVLEGGDGNDLLIARSDAGEQRIGQLAIDQPTRPDPDGEVDAELQKLSAYAHEALHGDDVLIGGAGRDTFLIAPQIDAKLDIIDQHIRANGSINWAGVAGENDELHDHWVDSSGIDIIADYNAEEDHIAVIGHTAVPFVTYQDLTGDGVEESIITVISVQHGNGGAHDRDLIGQVIVHGDRVEVEDIQTDDMVTYGVVEGYADVAEALMPPGDEKISIIDGVEVKGYDTREPMQMMAGIEGHGGHGPGTNILGPVTGNPYAAFENANFTEDMLAPGASGAEGYIETRAPFDQLDTIEATGSTITGTAAGESLTQAEAPAPDGLPGALGFWSLGNGDEGAYADLRDDGGAAVKAYTLYENQALLNTEATTEGPRDGETALYFNGDNSFAFLDHDPETAITQGTIALWVRPDDIGETSMFVTKDQSGPGEGNHFRLGHTDDGGLILRMADPYKTNHAWKTDTLLTEGEWAHLAVNFTEDGITVYLDGEPVPDGAWTKFEGDIATPGGHKSAMLLQNEEPWVLGADTFATKLNGTAQEFATDDEDLRHEFEGGLAEFGIWGGHEAGDALSQAEIADLITNGPGAALTNPSGTETMVLADDMISGAGGNDTIHGEGGDDTLDGGAQNDSIHGGYGDDHLLGGSGNDTLDGGRGNDLLEGGAGDDVLLSRSDTGEQRAGQLVLDDPSRPTGGSIDEELLKLADWIDQEVAGDDVLVGGAGADAFTFETLINGKKDILAEHTMDNGMIHWHGVAGENKYIHDHWVDGIGIDVVADFDKSEGDTISVIGHTTQIEVTHQTVDTDGDGIDDDSVSVILAYSQQGGGGGAHDEDLLGHIVVFGDKVEEDDVTIDPGAHYGIVSTIHEVQEAVAPNGQTKWIDLEDGTRLLGYDSRDVEGDPVGRDPIAYSSNTWLQTGEVDLASALPPGLSAANLLLDYDSGTFGGPNQPVELAHTPEQATAQGTFSFTFTADNPGNGQNQALISKDHAGFGEGGHMTAYITSGGHLKVRFQGEEDEKYLVDWKTKIVAGEDYHVGFTFDQDEIALYLNGELLDADTGYADGMSGNTEDLVIGGSTRHRMEENDNIEWHFDGVIENLAFLDRPLEEIELLFLAENGGDLASLEPLYARAAGIEADPEPEVPDIPGADDPAPTPPETGQPPADPPAEPPAPEAGEEDSGFGAIFSQIIGAILSIFGLGGDDNEGIGNLTPPTEDQIEEARSTVEDLLAGLAGAPAEEAEAPQSSEEGEEEELMLL
ncbi:MAG: hypothetical protein OIF48_01935 [Silicimonas sp.]|nr:hypothetical protein [Silicimonas sp.]